MTAAEPTETPAETPTQKPVLSKSKQVADLAWGMFFLTAVFGISGAIFDIDAFRTIRFIGLGIAVSTMIVAGALKLRENRASA